MLLGHKRLITELFDMEGSVFCYPMPEKVEATHIDLTIGTYYYTPRLSYRLRTLAHRLVSLISPQLAARYAVNLNAVQPDQMYQLVDALDTECMIVVPAHGMVLAHTAEFVGSRSHLVQPVLSTRSTVARLGVSAHISAGWGDPYFHGRWTLEIANHNAYPVAIPLGSRIASISFYTVVDNDLIYTRDYNQPPATWQPHHMLPRKGNLF